MVDVDHFVWKESDYQVLPSENKKERSNVTARLAPGEQFLRGPVPLRWLLTAIAVGNRGLNVAIALWWLVGIKKSETVRLTRPACERFGVHPRTASRILAQMETVGLVVVDRCRGRGPDVTVLPVGSGHGGSDS